MSVRSANNTKMEIMRSIIVVGCVNIWPPIPSSNLGGLKFKHKVKSIGHQFYIGSNIDLKIYIYIYLHTTYARTKNNFSLMCSIIWWKFIWCLSKRKGLSNIHLFNTYCDNIWSRVFWPSIVLHSNDHRLWGVEHENMFFSSILWCNKVAIIHRKI